MVSGIPGGLHATIAALLPGLRPSDAKVMRLVLTDSAFVQAATTNEVADRAGVSPATIVRAARAAGFDGFGELKRALVQDLALRPGAAPPDELTAESTVDDITELVLGSHASSIGATRATLDPSALRHAVDLLTRAESIVVFGVGTSAAPAADAAYRWTAIGCRVSAPHDARTAQLQARLLKPDSTLVAISHSGRSEETLSVVDAARQAGAGVVAITSFASSPLAGRATALLVAGGPDLGLHMAPSSSRLAHLAVVDILHAAISLADPPRSRRALAAAADIFAAKSR
ncbi:MurR/RpiR family transcriptional regulator [Actinophytocola sp.]|uniref:MurR/RpiR family transcriptional regulator n=1 Tax=Actinophytocola sp. TaxID=1872138 RepID=UPI002D4A35BF|nr:MurR/RpiR family transcriptional regulator [Actinophytocola sp.]HYQ63475.1 MurR/RpiR family transcriptional regulator [Actinophytocola sp.]